MVSGKKPGASNNVKQIRGVFDWDIEASKSRQKNYKVLAIRCIVCDKRSVVIVIGYYTLCSYYTYRLYIIFSFFFSVFNRS